MEKFIKMKKENSNVYCLHFDLTFIYYCLYRLFFCKKIMVLRKCKKNYCTLDNLRKMHYADRNTCE